MTDAELLLDYIQCKRIIHGAERSPGHHRLLKLGFIKEHPVSIKNLLITVTAAGRTAIGCRPAEYVGTHPTLWGRIPPDSAASNSPALISARTFGNNAGLSFSPWSCSEGAPPASSNRACRPRRRSRRNQT